MATLRVLTAAEQVAAHLRNELLRGSWAGLMPGSDRLAKELGVGHNTIDAALGLLEKEGLLVPQGVGRRRRIVLPDKAVPPAMRVAFLGYDPPTKNEPFIIEMLHSLSDHGHRAFFTENTLVELDMDVRRIARMYCGRRGIRVPQDVSLACLQESPDFAYCTPSVAHARWDHGAVVRRAVRWADNVARGKDDRRLSVAGAGFVEGGTIGPALLKGVVAEGMGADGFEGHGRPR